jgi:MFS family permease
MKGYNDPKNYIAAVITLCLCSLANGLLIVTLFPYAAYMVMYLLPGAATPETVGPKAGILTASFMAGRFLTAVKWGQVADTFGRVYVLQLSLVLSLFISLLFGTSANYPMAVFWRLCLGMSNAITSTSKTLASEIGGGDEREEKRAMGLVIGMRSWGFLLGPAIGGLLSDPIKQYPDLADSDGWLQKLLEGFPYLLPNIVVAIVCLIGAIMASMCLKETLEIRQNNPRNETMINNEQKPLFVGSNNRVMDIASPNDDIPVWNRSSTRLHMIFNCIFSFAVTVIDDGFPLFSLSTVGGLGFEEIQIGQVWSLAGLIFVVGQYITYAAMIEHLGLYPAITMGCALGLVPALLIPLSVWYTRKKKSEIFVVVFLGIILGITKIMICACFASLAIATNNTVPQRQRAEMNGLLLLGSSVAKGLGPIFAGFLVSLSFSGICSFLTPELGSILIFSVIGIMGIFVSLLAMRLEASLEA